MKAVIKLLIAAAIINAAARAAMAASGYYHLKDETEQLIRFGSTETTAELHNRILEKAGELELPVASENIEVRREGVRTIATASYTQPVELFPRYKYPVSLSFEVEAFSAIGAAR